MRRTTLGYLALPLALASLTSCQRGPSAPETAPSAARETTAVSPSPAPSPSAAEPPAKVTANAPADPGPKLAEIASLLPRVTYRRNAELAWQEASPKLPLYRYDAVRTHERAEAHLAFGNGSQLDLDEKTLVIINPAKTDRRGRPDRAVVRGGTLKSQTRSELWLLTSAALFKMKAEAGKEPAQATLSIEEGRQLKVELQKGTGTLIRAAAAPLPGKPRETPGPIQLKPNEPVILAAPPAAPVFGASATRWRKTSRWLAVFVDSDRE